MVGSHEEIIETCRKINGRWLGKDEVTHKFEQLSTLIIDMNISWSIITCPKKAMSVEEVTHKFEQLRM